MFLLYLLMVVGTWAAVTHDRYLHDKDNRKIKYTLSENDLQILCFIQNICEIPELTFNRVWVITIRSKKVIVGRSWKTLLWKATGTNFSLWVALTCNCSSLHIWLSYRGSIGASNFSHVLKTIYCLKFQPYRCALDYYICYNCESLMSNGSHFLGRIDMWTWPSS